MRKVAIAVGAVLLLLLGAWFAAFGSASPCGAMRAQVDEAFRGESAEVQSAVRDATSRASPLQCAAIAARLRAGDRSVISVHVVKAR